MSIETIPAQEVRKCDRCGAFMGRTDQPRPMHSAQGHFKPECYGAKDVDLCTDCWSLFESWLKNAPVVKADRPAHSCYHAPEQHDTIQGCRVWGCNCKWNGLP